MKSPLSFLHHRPFQIIVASALVLAGWLACRSYRPSAVEVSCCLPLSVGQPEFMQPPDRAIVTLTELPPHQAALWQSKAAEPEFAGFQRWVARYLAAPVKAEVLAEGIALAATRRQALKKLIVTDPAHALDLAVPEMVRRQLPAAVAALMEKRIDARGKLLVIASYGDKPLPPGETGITRRAVIDGTTLEAFVYGRRELQPTRWNIPLHGIALDGKLALSEWPARVLEPIERDEARAALASAPLCPTSNLLTQSTTTEVALRVAKDTQFYCSPVHGEDDLRHAAATESLLPTGFGNLSSEPVIAASDGTGIVVPSWAPTSDAAWTTGSKKLLLVRVDFENSPNSFTDYTGLSAADCSTIISNIDDTFNDWSYGKLRVKLAGQGSTVSSFVHLGKRADYHSDDVNDIWDEVEDKLGQQGLDADNYDYLVVTAGPLQLTDDDGAVSSWGGKGLIGGGRVFMQVGGDTLNDRINRNIGTAMHELGHNLGLHHSSIQYPYPKPIAIGGISIQVTGEEYGDIIDRMGSGGGEFNVRYKHWLHWLSSAEVPVAPGSGRFTLLAHDLAENGGVRGLQVPVVPGNLLGNSLFVEYRTSNVDWLPGRYGAGIRLSNFNAPKAWLLDTTPETFPDLYDNKLDSPLTIGHTFAWSESGNTVYLTTISADPGSDKLVVQVNRGPFAGNHAPVGSLSANPVIGGVDKTIVFIVAASDADGDELAYAWNLGDGPGHANSPTASRSFAALGTYPITCVVSDMKGGTQTLTMNYNVSIANPPTISSISDRTTDEDVPLTNIVFQVSDEVVSAASIVVTATSMNATLVPNGNIVITHLGGGNRAISITPAPNQHGSVDILVKASNGTFDELQFFNVQVLPVTPGTSFIAKGSPWRYYDAAAPPPHDWMSASASDAAWQEGPARFVFGQGVLVLNGWTELAAVPGRVTTYYRQDFKITDTKGTLALQLLCDDGAVVYLNGVEVYRQNMPGGTVTHTTHAVTSVEGSAEHEYSVVQLPLANVIVGDNLLAIEVHDAYARGTNDVSFDAALSLVLSPVVSDMRPETTPEDTPINVYFDADDSESPPGVLTFGFESSPDFMVSSVPEFGYDAVLHRHYLTITPQQDVNGPVNLTLKVRDGSSETQQSFMLNILPVNDPPQLDTTIPDMAIAMGGIAPVVNVNASDVDTPAAALLFTATSGNQAVVPNSGLELLPGKYADQRILHITPTPGIAAQSTITVSVSDGVAAPVTTAFVFRVSLPLGAALVPISLVSSGEDWRYLASTVTPGGGDWTSLAFDASTWSHGSSQLGYNDGDEVTVVPDVPYRVTTYFRRVFKVPHLAAVQGLSLRLLRDDGAVVYLNGTQIHTSNMPSHGVVTPSTLAVSDVIGTDENEWEKTVLDANALLALQPGDNVIAVEVHQSAAPNGITPGDLSFDLELEGSPAAPATEDVLISKGGDWRYWDKEGYPDGEWTTPNYIEFNWSSGLSRLGYGIGGESTVVDGGPVNARRPSVLFRKVFDVADPSLYTALHLMFQRDDGIRVWLNGSPVVTSNLAISANSGHLALSEVSPADFLVWHHFLLDASKLISGRNLILVELHQASVTGPDLGFDLQLTAAVIDQSPTLTLVPNGTGWELSWPAAYSAWKLHTSTTLQGAWPLVTEPSLLQNGWLRVQNSGHDPRRFFRLEGP